MACPMHLQPSLVAGFACVIRGERKPTSDMGRRVLLTLLGGTVVAWHGTPISRALAQVVARETASDDTYF